MARSENRMLVRGQKNYGVYFVRNRKIARFSYLNFALWAVRTNTRFVLDGVNEMDKLIAPSILVIE